MKTKSLIIEGLFAAIISVFSVITITIGPVPITLSLFAVFLTAILLGGKKSFWSVFVYILCGGIGLPVFSGFRGGAGILFGPTGGYIISYILITLIVGFTVDYVLNFSRIKKYIITAIVCILSLFVCYLLGTIQFVFITHNTVIHSLRLCVYPFIPFDLAKVFLAIFFGYIIKRRLKKIDF